MESLIESYLTKRVDFELLKSNTCHRLKALGDIEFIIELLEKDSISQYYKKEWISESLYLLAMLDYISKENNIPLCIPYDDMRNLKLKNILFTAGILVITKVFENDEVMSTDKA